MLVAAGLYTHGKIRDKKEAKKEKKRKAYEDRYAELEAEHKENETKQLQRRQTGESMNSNNPFNELAADESTQLPKRQTGQSNDAEPTSELAATRSSSDSRRSHPDDTEDGPGQWVASALKKRQTSQSLG